MRKSLLLLLIVLCAAIYGYKWLEDTSNASEVPVTAGAGAGAKATNEATQDVLLLVNKTSKLSKTYVPKDLVQADVRFSSQVTDEEKLLRKAAAEALEQLFAAARADGIWLVANSGFRSYESQTAVCDEYVRTRGKKEAERYCAVPGTSEHQSGLAMDIGSANAMEPLGDKFGETPEGIWVAKHAAAYGFIIRFPQGKENITGYAYEPWHIRYVGTLAAKAIAKQGATLEEYLASSS